MSKYFTFANTVHSAVTEIEIDLHHVQIKILRPYNMVILGSRAMHALHTRFLGRVRFRPRPYPFFLFDQNKNLYNKFKIIKK
jgi:hypothetical protein